MVNYLVCGIDPPDMTYQQKKKFRNDAKHFYWDEPHLYKHCMDGIMIKCVAESEVSKVIHHFHSSPYGGHAGSSKTQAKVLQSGFYWPTMLKDIYNYVKSCDPCHEMPQKGILEVEMFDVWGVDYVGPLPSSNGYKHILVAVDYVSKWVEAVPIVNADAK